MKKITSFTHFVTAEGDRISYSFSEISENGEITNQNSRGDFIVTDKDMLKAINLINNKLTDRVENM